MRGVWVLFILVCGICFTSAADVNMTQRQIAEQCLVESNQTIFDLTSYNISLTRFNDSYSQASNLYEAQVIIEGRKGKVNYGGVISYCDEIASLKITAVEALDFYKVFLVFYNENIDANMNASSVEAVINQINSEISGERYENVLPLIDRGYEEISSVKSEQTALALAYGAAAKGIGGFVKDNWIWLLSIVIFLIVFYLAYRVKIAIWMLNRKLSSLLLRKDTLKRLMSEAQRDYFQYGKIPESEYRIKIKNFGELVRDIDRQIPLIQQDIARFSFAAKEKQTKETDKERARRIGK
jgi:hypothetical protein